MTLRIVLASNNTGKLTELNSLFSDYDLEIIGQGQLGVSDVEESGLSFVENAIIKARHGCACTNLPCIADDSGLEVDALNGQPGIYSARFAGESASDAQNNARLLEMISDVPEQHRQARFRCVMVYLSHANDPAPIIAQGVFEGMIIDHAQGENGFGYDPLFFIPSLGKTCAQLTLEHKNSISHRALASKRLIEKLMAKAVITA